LILTISRFITQLFIQKTLAVLTTSASSGAIVRIQHKYGRIFAPKSHNNQSINNLSAKQTFTLGILGFELKPYHYGEA
jgi:hypothetical protein